MQNIRQETPIPQPHYQRIIHEWYVWFIVRFHGRNNILSGLGDP